MTSHYNVPGWAGKAPVGLHLDVLKGEKLTQKLMVDEKRCYLFGRNPQLNDFCIDHASCSRVHAALVWHKHLDRAFLVDLGSTHGTFIGSMRIDANKPTQLPIDSAFHFGASTRVYMLRERPQQASKPVMEELELAGEETHGELLGLPETETELDNLTEFNTAHNRRVTMLGIAEDDFKPVGRRRSQKRSVTFNEEEEVINPEDVDPSVGRFRNLVSTTVIPMKRARVEPASSASAPAPARHQRRLSDTGAGSLYGDLPPADGAASPPAAGHSTFAFSLTSKLGIGVNPAPEVEERVPEPEVPAVPAGAAALVGPVDNPAAHEPRKKKYAKEMWPGKKSAPALLV
ncbi:nuclear inhibitor of protein phosphatase 1-like [Amphibalanus amphitrite]|uniref:nuclear inhibitor of protein phosphatase 1-like n=1 Tax=Amphibalanus amphitrite TaxID=1232801 RepID=UPI001C925119|nr:nuclear inhibitor of protein phosphatase 1-like [Amphibalanus amphitrite]